MKKLSELDKEDRFLVEAVLEELQSYQQNTYKEQIEFIKEYELSLADREVIALLSPKKQKQVIPKNEYLVIEKVSETEIETTQKIYSEKWIVLQNRLLHAISKLSVNERRLIIFLSPIVRLARGINSNQRLFFVQATEFGKEFGISPKTVYRTLAEVAKSIQHKPFFYWEFRENNLNERGISWFSECEYMKAQGGIEVKLDDTVIEMLTVFDKYNPYTKYQKEYIAKLGGYGIVLFELIASCMYQNHKQKSYSIEYLRQKFDCITNYPNLFNFKRYVIDIAIKDVEKYTPYRISYTQKKKGKVVTELVFIFEDTTKIAVQGNQSKALKNKKIVASEPNTIDRVQGVTDKEAKKVPSWQSKGLTDGQINKIKVNMREFIDSNSSKISPNDRRDYPEIFESWRPMLNDPIQAVTFHKVQELLERSQ